MARYAGRREKVYTELMGIDEHAAAGLAGSVGHWQPFADLEAAGKLCIGVHSV